MRNGLKWGKKWVLCSSNNNSTALIWYIMLAGNAINFASRLWQRKSIRFIYYYIKMTFWIVFKNASTAHAKSFQCNVDWKRYESITVETVCAHEWMNKGKCPDASALSHIHTHTPYSLLYKTGFPHDFHSPLSNYFLRSSIHPFIIDDSHR